MNIARMNERITFQKNSVEVDAVGNHKNVWEDYFSCFSYASTYTANESEGEVTTEERSVTFCCRYCSELACVSSTGYRILFHGEIYNIRSVDMMNYQREELKFQAVREVRQ